VESADPRIGKRSGKVKITSLERKKNHLVLMNTVPNKHLLFYQPKLPEKYCAVLKRKVIHRAGHCMRSSSDLHHLENHGPRRGSVHAPVPPELLVGVPQSVTWMGKASADCHDTSIRLHRPTQRASGHPAHERRPGHEHKCVLHLRCTERNIGLADLRGMRRY